MLQVWREAEGQDHVNGDLRADELKHRRSLWDREEENVTLFVGGQRSISTMEGILDLVFAPDGTKALRVFSLGLLGIPVAD